MNAISTKLKKALFRVLKTVVRSTLKFDRYVVKKYVGIETPLYKLWWAYNVQHTQKLINRQK
jgi:hypothetical protein